MLRAARCRRRHGGGRSLSPSGRSLGHSSRGSASSSSRPPPRTQRSSVDQHLRRLRTRMGERAAGAPASAMAASVDRDRHHAVALSRARVSAADPPLLEARSSRRTSAAGWSAASASALAPRSRGASCRRPRADERERSRSASRSPTAATIGTAPKSGALVAPTLRCCCSPSSRRPARRPARPAARWARPRHWPRACVLRRRIVLARAADAVPSSTSRKTNARPVSPIRMRCMRSSSSSFGHRLASYAPDIDTMQAGALTLPRAVVKGAEIMNSHPHHARRSVAAAALAGCNKSDHTIVADPTARPDGQCRRQRRSVSCRRRSPASKTYRCKDNSLVYVDWLSDESGHCRARRTTAPTDGRHRRASRWSPKALSLTGGDAKAALRSPARQGSAACKA